MSRKINRLTNNPAAILVKQLVNHAGQIKILAKEINISTVTISLWKNGYNIPSQNSYKILEQYAIDKGICLK